MYEMFTVAGERACQRLVDRVAKRIKGSKRVTSLEIQVLVKEGMEIIAAKHGEVYDTEPAYHIKRQINRIAKETGYQPPFA